MGQSRSGVIRMKVLYVTTVSSTMNAFFKAHIEMLIREGSKVDLACNDTGWPIDDFYKSLGCGFYRIDFSRSPLSAENLKAYGQLKKVIENGGYDIVHCHTPNASVITRLVCRRFRKKKGLKVIYTAHGFHFYKGAPLKNWLLYYPIEKLCSRFTDNLITINKEDYELAKSKFKAKEVYYVPGVGIDLSRFRDVQIDRAAKRREVGVPENAFLLISIGELSTRKNHKVVIQALKQMNDSNVHYIIGGIGPLEQELKRYAAELGISDQVHFLGFREDVAELYKVSDIFCFPSVQEGLPVALMEAMACGLSAVCSRIRGNTDLMGEQSDFLVEPSDAVGFQKSIERLMDSPELRLECGERNQLEIEKFEIKIVLEKMKELYLSC